MSIPEATFVRRSLSGFGRCVPSAVDAGHPGTLTLGTDDHTFPGLSGQRSADSGMCSSRRSSTTSVSTPSSIPVRVSLERSDRRSSQG